MKQIIPYLIFQGECRQAFQFYTKAMNGEVVSLKTFGEAPFEVGETYKNWVYDAEFRAGDIRIKASDSLPEYHVQQGADFALFVSFSDEKERKQTFEALAQGGDILFPLSQNFGMLKDKHGIQWMFVCE